MTSTETCILNLSQIEEYLLSIELMPLIEKGFVAYSKNEVVVPPVGELIFDDPPGDTHIKYGYVKQEDYFAIKIASGFYNNPSLGLKASQGVILLFSQKTGELKCILLDEGLLTDIRTTIASMITIKYLAPKAIQKVGIIGTGIQAKLQLKYLHHITDCKEVMVWGRNIEKAQSLIDSSNDLDYKISLAKSPSDLASQCPVIITTTASKQALLKSTDVRPGTHITALGSDTHDKIELDPKILAIADRVVSDSISQSASRGEVYQARKEGVLNKEKIVELGKVIADPDLGRTSPEQITIADLTGVAVQDIMIATAIFDHHLSLQQASYEH